MTGINKRSTDPRADQKHMSNMNSIIRGNREFDKENGYDPISNYNVEAQRKDDAMGGKQSPAETRAGIDKYKKKSKR